MNDQQTTQTKRSEKIASTILRALAVVGLIAVLVLATWTIVQGSRVLPNAGDNIVAAISAVRSVFSSAPAESLVFEIENRTLAVDEQADITWVYTGKNESDTSTFMYECGTGVNLSILEDGATNKLACETPHTAYGNSVRVIPTSKYARFADVTLTVNSGMLQDTTVVTIVNTDILTSINPDRVVLTADVADTTEEKETENTIDEEDDGSEESSDIDTPATAVTTVPTTPTKTIPPVTTKTVVPLYSGPADLILNIEETGILVEVAGENTFFPISPIPDNKVAGVTFTVTNRGGEASLPWIFKAELPIEGDSNYKYTSPVQEPLTSGMQVTYTLGFDEILKSSKGTIKIWILPNDAGDKKSNNEDSVIITIDNK